ncbi:MAG: Phosphate starvation-inducible protein psiF precursor [Pseudomonadota bacterium]|jgi:hypothetical protein
MKLFRARAVGSAALLLATALFVPTLGSAQAKGGKKNAAQQRMQDCNAEAKQKALKGEERKAFMKSCLKKDAPAPAATPKNAAQQRMKDCNAQAKDKGLKGADRKAFMKTCLKK